MPLVSSEELQRAKRDEAISFLFQEGYPYKLILCFLVAVFGVCVSLSTLKRSLRRQRLRRGRVRQNIRHVGRCLLVSFFSSCVVIFILLYIG